MYWVGKVTPKEKQLLIEKGWEPEIIDNEWDGQSAEGDSREMVRIYMEEDLMTFMLSMGDAFRMATNKRRII